MTDDLRTRLKRRVLCGWFDLHVGHPERIGGWMLFYCVRCDRHVNPITPERTDAILRELYAEEGYDYDELHDTNDNQHRHLD